MKLNSSRTYNNDKQPCHGDTLQSGRSNQQATEADDEVQMQSSLNAYVLTFRDSNKCYEQFDQSEVFEEMLQMSPRSDDNSFTPRFGITPHPIEEADDIYASVLSYQSCSESRSDDFDVEAELTAPDTPTNKMVQVKLQPNLFLLSSSKGAMASRQIQLPSHSNSIISEDSFVENGSASPKSLSSCSNARVNPFLKYGTSQIKPYR